TLNETLDLKCLLTGYYTAHLPLSDACDHYLILIRYSTKYYKKRIIKQAKAFREGLEKIKDGNDILDNENSNEDNDNNLDEEKNNNETEENTDNKLQIAINT
ncbi:16177_t:CDS:2, partial [Racocetra persica]